MVVDSVLLIPSLLLLVAGVSLLTAFWRRQGSDRRRQWWRWWQQAVSLKSGAERQAGRRGSPLCRPCCSQQQASPWQGSPILPHVTQPGKTRPLLQRNLCPSLHTDSATGTTRPAGKPGRLPGQDQRPQVLVARGTPRMFGQRSRLGSGVQDLPPEILSCTKPPVKGMVFQEGLVQTEERKRWWEYKTKRPIWPMRPPALPRGHKKAGAAARPSRGPALSLEVKADSQTETCQPFNSGFSSNRSTEQSDRLAMERLYRQLLVSLKRPKTKNDC
ncbi:uncharacterized protein LOC121110426 [Gallus gallus]|uniref:uncharacterized protein LOC121110426 n=1 Tax=Gallus gallus TaxID=9031 RepID=UPI001AE79454|nr:uncharacterized protein LOC121110426 [Gallus gallus]